MSIKLALGNVKKSIKDYLIYFLTLTFGVCLFYVFNSMGSQQGMLEISSSQQEVFKLMMGVMGIVSVFIATILGFLVIYANKFLIKRRKKELGLYMTLGMDKGDISKILMTETMVIGILSLGVGLFCGIFASQGLSLLTAKLMKASIRNYYFLFSMEAFIKSIIYFGIIFIIVILFNTIAVSKYKLIDLIYGNRKNESLKGSSRLGFSVMLFVCSVLSLGIAYYMILKNGLQLNYIFYGSLLFGTLGTFLFYRSLSGFMLKLIKSNKKLYYRGLNMFILRQINSKINTTYISMTLICLMLFVTIGTVSSGLSLGNVLAESMEKSTPFDATFWSIEYNGDEILDIKEKLIEKGLRTDSFIQSDELYYDYVDESYTYGDLMKQVLEDNNSYSLYDKQENQGIRFTSLSVYNKTMIMQGKEPIELSGNEYAINCSNDTNILFFEYFIQNNGYLNMDGKKLMPANMGVRTNTMATGVNLGTLGTFIVPDNYLTGKVPTYYVWNINYKGSKTDGEAFLQSEIARIYGDSHMPYVMSTSIEVMERGAGIRTAATYFVLYIGIIFLITSAAVLALQQLSETNDNIERYRLLLRIGVEDKMMNGSIYMQILIYFLMPLVLAIIHSVVGLKVAFDFISQLGYSDVLPGIIFTSCIILFVYGGYFAATCVGSKNIIRVSANK